MADYQQLRDHMTSDISGTVLRRKDNAYIPDDGGNRDRQMYLQWVAEGNAPDPPDPLPEPPPPAPLELQAHPEGEMHAATKGYVDTESARLRAQFSPAREA